MVIVAAGVRIGWADLPGQVRQAIEAIIGASVVEAVSQPGGFSPGTADRVRTADGRRAFVKAVSPAQNEGSPKMHRREAAIAAVLPESLPVPRFLGAYDDGEWIALVFEDVEGRHPATPWLPDELELVLSTIRGLAAEPLPASLAHLPDASDRLAGLLAGWHRVAADPPDDLDPWFAARLDQLCETVDRSIAAVAGDRLVHCDLRADNLLLTPSGTVAVVDWPHAQRGAPWLDTLQLLVNVRMFGGHDPQALLLRLAAATDADPGDLLDVLAAFAGYFVDIARQAAPPGLPTVRDFQRAQGQAVLGWLRELDPDSDLF